MSNKVIIFLDIDGVLLPFPDSPVSTCAALFPDTTLQALSRILEVIPNALLVLSSTWRAQKNMINDIIEAFQQYGNAYSTPLAHVTNFYDLTDIFYHDERQYEIYRYLQQHPDYDAWIALDDEDLLLERYKATFQDHAIFVNSRVGLTNANADEAIRLLQKQIVSQRK